MLVPALRALLCDESGAALVEYALVLGLLSAASIAVLAGLGQAATDSLTTDGTALTTAGRVTP